MVIDAFSNRPFRGNPAAVVLMNADLPEELCQSLAAEFNQPETAYVEPLSDGKFGLRWFTPSREVLFADMPRLLLPTPCGTGRLHRRQTRFDL